MDKRTISNIELVTFAVYILGGVSNFIDTEDIAIKANDLIPGRFSWHKYPDQVNIENVRKRLSDAIKNENGGYIIGSTKTGWQISKKGLKFAKNLYNVFKDYSIDENINNDISWYQKEKSRLLSSYIYANYKSSGAKSITKLEAETFFRLDDYIIGNARERKLARILKLFGNDPDLGKAIRDIAKKVPTK